MGLHHSLCRSDHVIDELGQPKGTADTANQSLWAIFLLGLAGGLVAILRDEWGFDGIVISDFNAFYEMISHGICENEKECAKVCSPLRVGYG